MKPVETIIILTSIVVFGVLVTKGFELLAKYISDKGIVVWILFFMIVGLIFSSIFLSSIKSVYWPIPSGVAMVVIMNTIQKAYGW